MAVVSMHGVELNECDDLDPGLLHLLSRLGAPFLLDGHDGVRVAIRMLHEGEITPREFFELCEEAAQLTDAA
jgi:hypothetical protein